MSPSETDSAMLDRWAMGLLSDDSELLKLARRVTGGTQAPVVGGIAVFLHGYRRTTAAIDLHTSHPAATSEGLRRLGAEWDAAKREFRLEGVPVHLVTDAQTGGPPHAILEIQGVRVVSLPDLIRFKLRSGLDRPARSQDIADVVELIRRVPLDTRFAARLPKEQRPAFKKLVDAVKSAP